MRVVVSDANVLIDLVDGGIASALSHLPYQIVVPEILFEEELRARHGNLLDLGISTEPSAEDSILEVERQIRRYPRISRNDAFALVLAQEKQCVLLTGDQNLRKAAENCEIEVHGTVHLIENFVAMDLLTTEQIRRAVELMRSRGRRLPWATVDQLIGRL
ncbi:PIN domain-containing protein [Acidithrix ferrooxidans]|uniref:PIN domain-containing protein n=1 Tax=Acidithrix ferrooxidans TaxID=1280514 RepID=A0A0D8HIE0_9ACTN|nr:PIN domain-containing protein [Acidithrix ferrooxidans]KJF17624.1 hypothetical protein AXFE_15240 [Acidithrix ferrooxidans]